MNKLISIILGSESDLPNMDHVGKTLDKFNIGYEIKVISAHRNPLVLHEYVTKLEERGFKAVIAGAGGAAHLPGVIASKTILPVLGVPMPSVLNGLDSLLSIVQMPSGIPVATFAIGKAGAINAALYAVAILAVNDDAYKKALLDFRSDFKTY